MIRNDPLFINGDGETVRDFCYVDNVVQANLLAATAGDPDAVDQVYNVAVGEGSTLNELFETLRSLLEPRFPHLRDLRPVYREFRAGDVRLSRADIGKARRLLGYRPVRTLNEGLVRALDWYVAKLAAGAPAQKRNAAGRSCLGRPLAEPFRNACRSHKRGKPCGNSCRQSVLPSAGALPIRAGAGTRPSRRGCRASQLC